MVFLVTNSDLDEESVEGLNQQVTEEFSIYYDNNIEITELNDNICVFDGLLINERKIEEILSEEVESLENLFLKLDGYFTALIIDNQEIKIFRDIFGSRPVYYSKDDDSLFISSNIRSIIHSMPIEPDLCKSVAADYLANGMADHRRKTFFDGVNRLKPKEKLIVKKGEVNIKEASYSLTSHSRDLRSTVEKNIQNLQPEEEKYYCPVSGGLDSTITASKCGDAENIFISFKQGTGDSKYLSSVQKEYNLDIEKIEVRPIDLINEVKQTIETQEEPTAYPAVPAQSLLYKKIDDGSKIISGTGADELFYGYTWFLPFYISDKFKEGSYIEFIRLLINYRKSLGKSHLKGIKEILLEGSTTVSAKASDLVKMDAKSVKIENLDEARKKHLEKFYAPHMLKSTQKNSNHHNVDVRPVFLSKKLLELSEQIDFRENFEKGLKKYSLRKEFREDIPEKIFKRKVKTGFVHSGEDLFTDKVKRKFYKIFNSKSFQRRDLIKGKRTLRLLENDKLSFEIAYRFYSYEIWMREFID
ncbi:MAG: asparagine synthase-related protein [Candidatus Nanohaloarchaea archaeon]